MSTTFQNQGIKQFLVEKDHHHHHYDCYYRMPDEFEFGHIKGSSVSIADV